MGMVVHGNVELDNGITLIVEGSVLGSITQPNKQNDKLGATVVLENTAKVTGGIKVDSVLIKGAQLTSAVDALKVSLINNANIVGDVTYAELTVESGCLIKGSLIPIECAPSAFDVHSHTADK